MRLTEFQLAGELPSTVQRAAPVQQQLAAPAPSGTNFGEDLLSLLAKQDEMDPSDPRYLIINKLADIVVHAAEELPAGEGEDTAMQEGIVGAVKKTVSSTSRALLVRFGEAAINALIERVRTVDPETASKFETIAAEMNAKMGPVYNEPQVKKSMTAAIKGIQLNTKGEIAKMDKDIEAVALEFAKRFGVERKWARNIVGMFSVNISHEDRTKFLKSCIDGTAIDFNKMVQMKEGDIEDCVTTNPPSIKQVFDSVKDTLLDISLSTGQRGATGPFEAMLAIMGGAEKPAANEGGDLKINGKKYEVKATSIGVDADSPNTAKMSNAWLDSTAGGEIGGSYLRNVANTWINDNWPGLRANKNYKAFNEVWSKSDFRAKLLPNLKQSLVLLEKAIPKGGYKLLYSLMASVYPNVAKAKGYNFSDGIYTIIEGINEVSPQKIANVQGTMALLEYLLGKGNDGFIFFNSSTQRFRIVDGVKGVLEVAKNPDEYNIHYLYPMTMGNSAKCAPALYYGATATSPEAKEYVRKFNSSPERVKMYQEKEAERKRASAEKKAAKQAAAKNPVFEDDAI